MAPRKRARKAVAQAHVAEPRCSGRTASRSANVADQSGRAMTTPKPAESSRARAPRRAAARGKWSEEQLMTSDQSMLIDIDLVKLLAQPQAWNCLDESEKREILALLPPDVHPEAQAIPEDSDVKIDPIPESFIRYSNNWRDGIRQFQLDLQNGRYDPEWLHQAEIARRQRENGEFDNFKEREYEQFWGQKQKVAWRASAGESARVKMKTLIDEGVIQLGDIWKFHYVFRKETGKITIEKETRIHEINGARLTFAVPSGERVFLRGGFKKPEQPPQPQTGTDDIKMDINTEQQPLASISNDDDVKDEILTEPQPISTPPTHRGAKHEEPASQVNIAHSKEDQEKFDRNTDTPAIVASSSTEKSQEMHQDLSVVIVSPDKKWSQRHKRTIPEPEPQSPVNRKRRQPRRNAPKQLKVEPFKEPEVPEQPEVPQEVEMARQDRPDLSVMSILEAKIAESYKDKPEPFHQASDSSEPVSSMPVKKEDEEEVVSTANINHKSDKTEPAMVVDSSAEQPGAPADSVQVHAKADQDKPDTTAADEKLKPESPTSSQPTTNESDEVLVPNIASPQALVQKILQIDGRVLNSRTGNAWKEIRCYRNNQDMGSLFDVREAWFLQHGQDK